MSAIVGAGYKTSQIGPIPTDWTVASFGSLLSESPQYGANATAESAARADRVRYIRITDIHENGSLIDSGKKYLNKDAADGYLLADQDIVIARTGNTVGKSLLYRTSMGEAAFAGYLIRFRTGDALDCRYASQFLRSDAYWAWVRSSVKVGAQPNINSQQYQSLLLPLPSVAEQQKIAAILEAVDDKLDMIARQIEATQTLKQGLMQALFSQGAGVQSASGAWLPHEQFKEGPIGTVPQCWEFCTLGDLAVENITYGVVQPGEAVVGGVPMVRGGDIKDGEIAQNLRTISSEVSSQFKRTILEGGELLVSLVGYPGETAVVPMALKGANIARQAGMIRTESLALSKYLHCYLASPAGKAELLGGMIGSAQQVINLKSLRDVQVPMPPAAEREQITAVCEAISAKLRTLSAKQRSYGLLKRGLMQKLLTGEWRVKVDAEMAA